MTHSPASRGGISRRALVVASLALGVSTAGSARISLAREASSARDAAGSTPADAAGRADQLVAAADLSSGEALVSSLAAQADPQVAADSETVTDVAGNEFAMPVRAERVICLNNNAYDVICALGCAGKVIGVNDTTTPDPSTPDVPSFGDLSKPNVEQIIEAAPDLVLAYSSRLDEGVASQLEDAGVAIARVDLYKPATCADELAFLGNVFGQQERAAEFEAVVEGMQALVAQRVEGTEPLRTYWEIYADYKSAGAGSGADQIMALAGVQNMAGSEKGSHVKVSDEWVISANPQLIVRESSSLKGATGRGVKSTDAAASLCDTLAARPGWNAIGAVRDGHMLVLDTDVTTNPLGFALAPLYVAAEAYPEQFVDMPAADDVLAAMFARFWPGEDRSGLYAYAR